MFLVYSEPFQTDAFIANVLDELLFQEDDPKQEKKDVKAECKEKETPSRRKESRDSKDSKSDKKEKELEDSKETKDIKKDDKKSKEKEK